MNDQRQVIFSQRLDVLVGSNIDDILEKFIDEKIGDIEKMVGTFNEINKETYLATVKNITGNAFDDDKLINFTKKDKKQIREEIKNFFREKRRSREEKVGLENNKDIEKKILLQIIDFAWRQHIQYLEQLRQVIGLRSYGQKDPLSEFKKEAFALFQGLLERIKNETIKFLLNLNIIISNENEKSDKLNKSENNLNNTKKIGRNEKCPCGSGKKYKHCCGSI